MKIFNQLEYLFSIIITVIISNLCAEYSIRKSHLSYCINNIKFATRYCDDIMSILFIMDNPKYYKTGTTSCIGENDIKDFDKKLGVYSNNMGASLAQISPYLGNKNKIYNKILINGIKLLKSEYGVYSAFTNFLRDKNYHLQDLKDDFLNDKRIVQMHKILNDLELELNNLNNIYYKKNKIGVVNGLSNGYVYLSPVLVVLFLQGEDMQIDVLMHYKM